MSKKLTLYFVRHGETQYNTEKRIQGFCDSPLTKKGILQAKSVGKGLDHIDFTVAYASSSQRVLDTAKYAIGDRTITLNPDDRLKEMNFGMLEALVEEDIIAEHGNILEKIFSFADINFTIPNGESFTDLFNRTKMAIDEIVAKHKDEGGNILIFSHGVTIGYYIKCLTEMDDFPHHDNCCVSVVSFENDHYYVEKKGDPSFRDNGSKYITK